VPRGYEGESHGYEIGFSSKGTRQISVTLRPTARDALKFVRALKAGDDDMHHIKAPLGNEIDVAELQLLAERESGQTAQKP
jgi:hypothetical protein